MGLGAAVPHVVDGGGLVYEATATTNVTVQGVAAQESTMTAPALGGETSVTVSNIEQIAIESKPGPAALLTLSFQKAIELKRERWAN